MLLALQQQFAERRRSRRHAEPEKIKRRQRRNAAREFEG
jgi:hypothetical protein